MRVSIPGAPGIYYDTDSGSSALQVAMTAAGRRAPKPKGYAIQLLPYLWSFDVDLREVPTDHPIQYLHPEGAQSLGELPAERGVRTAGADIEAVLQFVWAVNREVESGANSLIGRQPSTDGITIEVRDGAVGVDGEELETDAFDLDEGGDSNSSDIPTEGGISGDEELSATDELTENDELPSETGISEFELEDEPDDAANEAVDGSTEDDVADDAANDDDATGEFGTDDER